MRSFSLDNAVDLQNPGQPYSLRDKTIDDMYVLMHRQINCCITDKGLRKNSDFSIGGDNENESLCFKYEQPFWQIYYSERGKKRNISLFISFFDAALHFQVKLFGYEGELGFPPDMGS